MPTGESGPAGPARAPGTKGDKGAPEPGAQQISGY